MVHDTYFDGQRYVCKDCDEKQVSIVDFSKTCSSAKTIVSRPTVLYDARRGSRQAKRNIPKSEEAQNIGCIYAVLGFIVLFVIIAGMMGFNG